LQFILKNECSCAAVTDLLINLIYEVILSHNPNRLILTRQLSPNPNSKPPIKYARMNIVIALIFTIFKYFFRWNIIAINNLIVSVIGYCCWNLEDTALSGELVLIVFSAGLQPGWRICS